MKAEFFVKLSNPIKKADSSVLDELKISIDHYKDGLNLAYGCYEKSGIKIFFTPIHREGRCSYITLLGRVEESGFRIHVLDAKRKLQKKIDKVASAIEPLLSKFGEIWGQDDFNYRIANMIFDATKDLKKNN